MTVMMVALSMLGQLLRLEVNKNSFVVFWVSMCLENKTFDGREDHKSADKPRHCRGFAANADNNTRRPSDAG